MKFSLSSVDPTATDIFSEEGELVYTVSTSRPERHKKGRPVTSIHRASGDLMASLSWHPVNSAFDKVTIGAMHYEMIDFKKGKLLLTETALFADARGRWYEWNRNKEINALELTAKDTDEKIVSVELVTRDGQAQPTPLLTFAPRAMELQDMCIMTWLFLEKQHRYKLHAANSTKIQRILSHFSSDNLSLSAEPAVSVGGRGESSSIYSYDSKSPILNK
ncbi:hypothetical protein SISSUDRAFT_1042429 [Sistotremastrum suecicum HHB10207 ss-3]|uniref:DUF6593 domain-containing protein n=1 Tax=Sistotremastrum suecicum HHB10207 ss-3 TaxID=1314776 RepID=A0A166GGA1_9AGAM|nr:hypothetical protein SISSUDRAFT_1042429 [Sistotremastrum suecicum HHB10207 ss-3]